MRYRIDFPLADLQPNPFPSEPLPRKASDLNISRLSALIATARIIPPWGAEPRGYLHCFAQALVRAQALFNGLRVLTQVKHGHDDYARNFHGIENAVWVVGHQ